MTEPVFYLGDTHLHDAAAYLAGMMHSWGWDFDYVPSDRQLAASEVQKEHSLYILSDYPAENLASDIQQSIIEQVADGAGLIMIGGWESFHGLGGNWDGTPIANILPVVIGNADDRVNCDRPVLLARRAEHPAVADLPWDDRPPVIGGFNRVTAKDSADVVLEAIQFAATRSGDEFTFLPAERDPLLVFGHYGNGKTAALMTDVAPHWVGPLVDWGDDRVTAQAPDANEVEVGDLYVQFFRQLLTELRG